MVTLIVTEKPDASKKIARALAKSDLKQLSYQKVPYYSFKRGGKKFLVSCAVGHLFSLSQVKTQKKWTYPVFDIEWKPAYKVSKHSEFTIKYVNALAHVAKKADAFINACDYDTEGELIFKNVLYLLIGKKRAKRMKFGTLTKEDLENAFENMANSFDKPLALAGETRHFLDFLYGVNSSRALMLALQKTKKGYQILSAGRVQSPTLALLARKEAEIKRFKPRDYWQLFAHLNTRPKVILHHVKDRMFDGKLAKQIYNRCKKKKALVTNVRKNEFKSSPPLPFNITSLQTESYRLYGFSPKRTLDIAQKLYTKAYSSYPRTSSEKLPTSINYKKILKALLKVTEAKKSSTKILGQKIIKPVEGKKTDPAHIAIYPTASPPKTARSLNVDDKKIYHLIVKRFLAVFGEPAQKETITAELTLGKEQFKVKGTRTLVRGWMEYYDPFSAKDKEVVPNLEQGKSYAVTKLDLKHDQTKPPGRYSQGSIITEMEKHGLGTRATRSNILQTLYDRNYIDGKSIKVTALGKKIDQVLEQYVPDLVDEKLTQHFEQEVEKVREGKKQQKTILAEAKTVLNKISKEFKDNEDKIGKALIKAYRLTRDLAATLCKCRKCEKGKLKLMYSKKIKAKFIGCSRYPDCDIIFKIPQNGLIKPAGSDCKDCSYPNILYIRAGKRPSVLCFNPKCPKKRAAERKLKSLIDKHTKKPTSCPECKEGTLIVRKGIYGAFLGCSNFPKCRCTKRLDEDLSKDAKKDVKKSPKPMKKEKSKKPSQKKTTKK